MTHYIIADTMAEARKIEADYRVKNPDADVRLISASAKTSVRAIEGTRLFPGDTFVEPNVESPMSNGIWFILLESARKSRVKIRRRMGNWIAIPMSTHPIFKVDPLLDDVRNERVNQLRKWGVQHHEFRAHDGHPDFDCGPVYRQHEERYKRIFEQQVSLAGVSPTWDVILLEEVYEALAEDDPKKRVTELIQVAAVALAIIEDIQSQ